MRSPRAMRYNDLMESATTCGGLPYPRFGKGEPLVALPGVSDSLCARARNLGELSFEMRGLAADRHVHRKIKIPTLITGGSRNALVSVRQLRVLAAAIPGTALKISRGAPHGLCEQQRRKYDRLVLEFLAS